MKLLTGVYFLLAAASAVTAKIEERDLFTQCPTNNFDYDYIVVGAGTGGALVATRLALAGFKVGVIEHGRDYNTYNVSITSYFGRAAEDPQIALDYNVKLYKDYNHPQVTSWYPRSSGLGGCAIHNAMVHTYLMKNDFDTMAATLNDPSWKDDNMRNYFMKLEKNLYLPPGVPGRGYNGWLSSDRIPTYMNDPKYHDPQLIDLTAGVRNIMPTMQYADFNTFGVDSSSQGGAEPIVTTTSGHLRSSVRDFFSDTRQQKPTRLNIVYETLATKILTCNSLQGVKAYGVEVVTGPNLLPAARLFTGKQNNLQRRKLTAKYEVIISAGVFQTPQLLKLSGIGPLAELWRHNIQPVKILPGVGENLIDRLEISVIWKLKEAHRLFRDCKWGDDPATDPCLQEWIDTNHQGPYSTGPAIWATIYKSNPSLTYHDIWNMWTPGFFRGYHHGFSGDGLPDVLTSIAIKGHTGSRGSVLLTGNHPQDPVDINKNMFGNAEGKKDLKTLREAVKRTRSMALGQTLITKHIKEEYLPGADVNTDEEIENWIKADSWGHHACCTSKMGPDSDPKAVVDNNFRVKGVRNLRIVDISIFPEMPGQFVTTPIYVVAEKASDVIINYANNQHWNPTP